MKFTSLNYLAAIGLLVSTLSIMSCKDSAVEINPPTTNPDGRWITVAGAVMGTTATSKPGDGNGGTKLFSVSAKDAKDFNFTIDPFTNGFSVKSNRTARLQTSEDGNVLFNISYGNPNGGEFSRFKINGGNSFTQEDVTVSIFQYATESPRWLKLFDGDKTGVAVNVADVKPVTEGTTYKYSRGRSTILALDLQNVLIKNYKHYEIPLSAEEEAKGYYISRLDAPVLNKAGNKLIIGFASGKHDPKTAKADENPYPALSSKSVVVDYPSLENPKVISSTISNGSTNGYRSFNAFLGNDGMIYQASQRDDKGSHILRIGQNNEYDNSYVFSLDAALKVKGSYIECWRYVGDGIAYVLYTHDGAPASKFNPSQQQSYAARVDLNAKTATKLDLPDDVDVYYFQHQGIAVDGDDVYLTYAPVGKEGRIYVINRKTGEVKPGAKLANKPGNHYIGTF
ncbi:hypothetical protein [Sphingobacterium lactis]|uniref:hypothetical protein n=1 Tax=Sphingobacterium lactis TaxID=797291 RepID=UPI003F7F2C43